MTIQDHAIVIEQGLLGAILIDPQAYNASASLTAQDFVEPIHGELFEAMGRLIAEGRAVTPMALAPLFEGREIGIPPAVWLTRMMSACVSVLNAGGYAATIREMRARRMMLDVATSLKVQAENMALSPSVSAIEAVQLLDDIIAASRKRGSSRSSLAAAAISAIDAIKNGGDKGITTGLRDMDRVLGGGWHRGELTLIAARPSMGKSAFAVMTAVKAARSGYGVLVFSLEMTMEMLALRALSDSVWNSQTPLPYESLRWRELDAYTEGRLRESAEEMRDLPVTIDDQFGLSMAEIIARSRQEAARLAKIGKSLDVVIGDHIGMVAASGRYAGQKVQETGEKSKAFLGLAKDMNLASVALSQLSRDVEKRGQSGGGSRRPSLSDLRDSGNLEEDASVVGFLYRPSYYLEREKFDDDALEDARKKKLEKCRNDLEILVSKNRNGPCKNINVLFDVASNVIRDKA